MSTSRVPSSIVKDAAGKSRRRAICITLRHSLWRLDTDEATQLLSAFAGRDVRYRGGSDCGSAMAKDGKSRRSFLSDRLELRLLLVAQRRIEVLERGAHQIDRLLHGSEPPVHCVKASGWCDRVVRLALGGQDVDSPGIGVLQHFE